MLMPISRDNHRNGIRNGNKTPDWECKWERVGKTIDGNGNDPYSHGKNSHGFFYCWNIISSVIYWLSGFCTTQ